MKKVTRKCTACLLQSKMESLQLQSLFKRLCCLHLWRETYWTSYSPLVKADYSTRTSPRDSHKRNSWIFTPALGTQGLLTSRLSRLWTAPSCMEGI
ncbi:hypothetical protein DPMN_051097 [Dreissena polymorpha]|uniref:Uncharacterized protein n=1 Tax=Dreissena polymorpha TaxID=45954 RepID=A0A9D4HPX8_DREPO|nr:hypothetical protein DPMN_051097 [Dreissena polymorpha]